MPTFDDPAVQAILRGRRSVTPTNVGLPGADLRVGVRALSEQDIDDAHMEAQRYLTSRVTSVGLDVVVAVDVDPEPLDRAIERELVFRAFMDPDNPERPFFPSPATVRTLDSALMRALLNVYTENQERISPRGTLSEEEVKQLVAALGKELSSPAVLAHLEPSTLRSCVRSLALALQASSPTGKSSIGDTSQDS